MTCAPLSPGGEGGLHRTRFQKTKKVAKTFLSFSLSNTHRPAIPLASGTFDVLAEGAVVGRIFKVNAAPVGTPWMWTLAFAKHEDRTPTHGYELTREAAMAAFAKSWRRA
jgi:hypothetical protein